MRNLIEIKPCPFCGGKAIFRYFTGDFGYRPAGIQCTSCLAQITMDAHDLPMDQVRAITVDMWNRRVGDDEAE